MKNPSPKTSGQHHARTLGLVLLFWAMYTAITMAVGFVTSKTMGGGVWSHTLWGLLASCGVIVLTLFWGHREDKSAKDLGLELRLSSLTRFSIGVLIGLASFGIHILVVTTFAGSIRFEFVPEAGAVVALVFFVRYLSTACMEELAFRGYALQRLNSSLGSWPAVWICSIAFGLSHLTYGWDMRTIILGVIPGGLLWGISALASRGLAIPIGLHFAWNFAGWSVGDKGETGLLRMVVEESARARTQQVGTVSYLAVFGILTLAFWVMHRRHTGRLSTKTQN